MKTPLRGFVIGALLLAAAALTLRLMIARREWFFSDDFFFLAIIQDPHWSWAEAFLPTRQRVIGAYRPIGLDAYFFANFALFGWNSFGYYVSALAAQLATGFMLVRVATHYALDRRAAWASGLFAVLAGPSCVASFEVAEHNYISAALGYTCSLAWFLDDLARPRVWLRWLSCLALGFGLLSNEVCASLPLVAFLAAALEDPGRLGANGSGWQRFELVARARRALHACWPQLLVAGLYIDFKFSGVPMRQESWFYDVDISSDMLNNTLGNLVYVSGGTLRLLALGLAALLLAALRLRERASKPWTTSAIAPVLVGAAWLLLTLLPFSVLAFPASRFGLVQLPAAGLLLGCLLDSALPRVRAELRGWAVLAALALLTPWPAMLQALPRSRGAVYKDAYAVLARELPGSEASCVTVVCNTPDLASDAQCDAFRDGTFGGSLFRAVVLNRQIVVTFSDRKASVEDLDEAPNSDCLRYYLKPDLTLTRESPALNATARLF